MADHVDALRRHGVEPAVVLYDPATIDDAAAVAGALARPLARPSGLAHDPDLLGRALGGLVRRG